MKRSLDRASAEELANSRASNSKVEVEVEEEKEKKEKEANEPNQTRREGEIADLLRQRTEMGSQDRRAQDSSGVFNGENATDVDIMLSRGFGAVK